MRWILKNEATVVLINYAVSKALAFGPKLLRLTTEQCRCLEHVDINVAFHEYQQPYLAVFVEIPPEYRNEMFQRTAVPFPRYVLSSHDAQTESVLVAICGAVGERHSASALMPHQRFATLEDALRFATDQGTHKHDAAFPERAEAAEIAKRIALNACMMLTHLGVREDGPSDPGQVKALQRAIRRRKPSKADQAKSQLAIVPTLISFKQEINFCTEANRTTSNGDERRIHGDGTPKKPHWRRGYFRNQRIGPGRVETKLTFIKPVFVNSDHFGGDLKDTEVVYKG